MQMSRQRLSRTLASIPAVADASDELANTATELENHDDAPEATPELNF
ncbi:hypothetical protein [Arthrobacter sp. CAU 1506]|nr:hypothetical protein [Arthrobacter sp. CAU 1506]